MVSYFRKTDKVIENINLVSNGAKVYIIRQWSATRFIIDWTNKHEIHWSSYKIKETDWRVKTASFISPQYIDLTKGSFGVLIVSPYHENFSGFILSAEYDKKTGLYTYQCQDFSRKHQTKSRFTVANNDVSTYQLLRSLLTLWEVSWNPTKEQLDKFYITLSGLRPIEDYNQEEWGSIIKFNPMKNKSNMIVKNKRNIEIMRDLTIGTGADIDLWFNDMGVLQFEQYNEKNFRNNFFWMSNKQISEIKMKFDITNILTGARLVKEKDVGNFEDTYYGHNILSDMFGNLGGYVEDPTQETNTNNDTKSTNNNSGGDVWKRKSIWIVADGGSGDFKNDVANILKNKGWNVHVGGTGPGYHYTDYFNVTSNYEVYAMVCNGFCAGSMREAYSSKIQNVLKKKNVTLCTIFDTRGWTNPHGMKPYRYGNFSGYSAGRAWDDNFSSSDPSIRNVADWLCKNHAVYCADPTPSGCVDQLLKGGWFRANNWNC